MNTKFVKVVFIAAIVLMGGVNFVNTQSVVKLSDVAMDNVEALADEEYDYENGYARKSNQTVADGPYYHLNPSGGYYEVYYVYNEVKCYDPGILKCQEDLTYVDTSVKEYNGVH